MAFYTLAVLAAASGALAATPKGFTPAAQTDLLVMYQSTAALDGNVIARDATANMPTLGTQEKLTGTSYTVIMIDLDIPTNNPPMTGTLLHWMQMGLMPATTAQEMGGKQAFMLMMPTQGAEATAAAAYIQPNPPARVPLSHRYTEILVDTSNAPANAMNALMNAAKTRMGFNAMEVLQQAGLMDKVVAGNFFNVTNAGPVNSTSTGGGSGMGSGRASGTMSMPTTTAFAGASGLAVPGLLGLAAAAAFFVGL